MFRNIIKKTNIIYKYSNQTYRFTTNEVNENMSRGDKIHFFIFSGLVVALGWGTFSTILTSDKRDIAMERYKELYFSGKMDVMVKLRRIRREILAERKLEYEENEEKDMQKIEEKMEFIKNEIKRIEQKQKQRGTKFSSSKDIEIIDAIKLNEIDKILNEYKEDNEDEK